MLKCREITELANGYLEHELPFMQRAQFRLHIMMCKHCRRYMDQLARTVKLLGAARRTEIAASVEDNLVRLLKEQRQSH